jgi:hypothetical protein
MSPAIELALLRVRSVVFPAFPIRSEELFVDIVTLAFEIEVAKLSAPGAGSMIFPPVPCRDREVKVGLWTPSDIDPPAVMTADVWKVAVPELIPVLTEMEPFVLVTLTCE